MTGRLYGGEERTDDTVDFPVAMPPVRPMMSILYDLRDYCALELLIEHAVARQELGGMGGLKRNGHTGWSCRHQWCSNYKLRQVGVPSPTLTRGLRA